jgi:large subunit ribosomal protein L9
MKIILRQDMDALGLEGDIVDVANGYARNFLIPKGIALEANMQNVKWLET